MGETEDARLLWDELPPAARTDLAHKLEDLYGHEDERSAFDALAVDKQQALLLFAARLRELDLWPEIERIENVYGLGGVGLNVRARRSLTSTLAAHGRFSRRFAAHGDTAGGFLEIGRARAALHFLRMKEDARRWSIHFDLHAPTATARSLLLHLWHEKWRGERPDWRAIKAALV
ncbi:MAG TPA: hypothetical protein VF634_09470 [Pyrinomonadaceae bacterium]|jgi:hypothetical protein